MPKPKKNTNEELNKAEQFYIEKNSNKTDLELAADLDKPLPIIQQYLHLHSTRQESRVEKLLIKHKGCTVMTEGASMAGDASRKGYITEIAIQNAVQKGDYEEAARLKSQWEKQVKVSNDEIKDHRKTYIYYLK